MDKIVIMSLGSLSTNCYIIPAGGKAIVIDPAESDPVLTALEYMKTDLGAIIITHGHFDHFAGAARLRRLTKAPIYASRLDADMMTDAEKCWADFMPEAKFTPTIPDEFFSGGETFSLFGCDFKVLSTPGHTAGSCLLFFEDVIFAGDTLFRGSVGRTDGYSGSYSQQKESMRKIAAIEGQYTVYCGHGEHTMLSEEKRCNPYIIS